jgi:hypothetical protein
MFPSEFNPLQKYIDIFWDKDLMIGRMIGGSKSGYRNMHPDNEVVFNANIVIESGGKIWHGDLDITLDRLKLQNVADAIGEDLYILGEHDARWGNEDKPAKELIKLARYKIEKNDSNSN